jgi:hypothetical protein
MIVSGIATAAAAAVIGTLTFHSGRNIIQTHQIASRKQQNYYCQNEQRQLQLQQLTEGNGSTTLTTTTTSSPGSSTSQQLPQQLIQQQKGVTQPQPPTKLDDVLVLKRSDLLKLYLDQCYIPESISYINGEWNGTLLPNNGLVRENQNF